MISISAQRHQRTRGSKNAPTPERLAKADAPVRTRGRYQAEAEVPGQPSGSADLLQHWRARGVITAAQHGAGRRFQRLFEKAAIGTDARSSGDLPARRSQACLPATPSCTLARSELAALQPLLGAFDFRLLCNVLGRGADLAAKAPDTGDGKAYVARRIRDALSVLAMPQAA